MSLRLIRRTTTALPLVGSPPAFAVEVAGLTHVFAAGARNRGAVHVALDREGAVAWPPETLPLSVTSAGSCGGEVIAIGVHEEKGVRWAMSLERSGSIHWETALPLPTSGLQWAVPACMAGETGIVWEVEGDAGGELGIATVRGGTVGPVWTFAQPGVAFGLGAATIGTDVFVLRSRGAERQAVVLRLKEGSVAAQVETVKNAHAIAAIGGRLAVLAWTREALLLQWLDASLAPVGEPETIATAPSPSWVRFAMLHAAGDHRIAISYLVGVAGDLVQMPSGRSEPGEDAHHFLGCYDLAAHALTDIAEVMPAGTAWMAGAWLGERLLLVHGAMGAALSIFELDRRAP